MVICLIGLIISGTENLLTIMLEAEASNIDRHLFLDGVKVGLESCSKIATSLKAATDSYKVEKRLFKSSSLPQETIDSISRDMEVLCEQKIRLEKILALKSLFLCCHFSKFLTSH